MFHNSMGLSRELLKLLYDPNALEWDSGVVTLGNGHKFALWSPHDPAPESKEGEGIDEFTARQISARQRRQAILANRAQRIDEARRIYRARRDDPSKRQSRSPFVSRVRMTYNGPAPRKNVAAGINKDCWRS